MLCDRLMNREIPGRKYPGAGIFISKQVLPAVSVLSATITVATEVATSVSTIATAETTSAATTTLRTFLSNIDFQGSAFKLIIVKLLDSFVGVFHFNKAESAGSASHLVGWNFNCSDFPVLGKKGF